MTLYLLHFERPFKHAKHYLGWAEDDEAMARRIQKHREGKGANLMKYVKLAGIDFVVARTWAVGSRRKERSIKKQGGLGRCCPICKANGYKR